MRASGELLCVVVAACSGCATVSRQGPRVSVERLEYRCVDTHLSGKLKPAGDTLELTIVADTRCASGEVDTFTTERYAQSWVPAAMLGVGAGAVVAVPLMVGIAFALAPGNRPTGTDGGEVLMLGFLPGVAAGTAVAYAIGKSETRLPDGKPQRVERVMHSEETTRAPSGVLRPDGESAYHWEVKDGVALLPLAVLRAVNLKRLLLQGQLVEFDGPSQSRAEALDDCRLADRGVVTSCGEARRRLAAAESCTRAAWPLGDELTAALRQAAAACP